MISNVQYVHVCHALYILTNNIHTRAYNKSVGVEKHYETITIRYRRKYFNKGFVNRYYYLFFSLNFNPGSFSEILNTQEGLEYSGVRSVTSSGIPCQEWNKYTPHSHKLFDRLAFPERSVSKASNYCRNPNKRPSGPWCYTVDPKVVSETCGIATSKGI